MKKIKGIGEDTGSFNPKEFYLMGHSAGGHLCSIAATNMYVLLTTRTTTINDVHIKETCNLVNL
jgi:alpha-beta hydrolase superfamily lysophospholipase